MSTSPAAVNIEIFGGQTQIRGAIKVNVIHAQNVRYEFRIFLASIDDCWHLAEDFKCPGQITLPLQKPSLHWSGVFWPKEVIQFCLVNSSDCACENRGLVYGSLIRRRKVGHKFMATDFFSN
jgi:hypothetical protein